MESVREGYATPPTVKDLYVYHDPDKLNSSNSSLSGYTSVEDGTEESQAIPSSLIKYKWQLVLGEKATISDLTHAIDQCKALVLETESGSDERKWIVRHLIELRLRAEELKDALEDPSLLKDLTKVILGHHFKLRENAPTTSRQYCDHCSGTIWSVVQASYICADCGYCCHHKCVNHVLRVCALVIVTELEKPIEAICPEKGLAAQLYRCFECHALLIQRGSRNIISGLYFYLYNEWYLNTFNIIIYNLAAFKGYASCLGQYIISSEGNNTEPRLCDYSGYYYCSTCHWNSESIIPARVIHNWDFQPRFVSRSSLQVLNLFYNRPVIDLQRLNARLLHFVPELSVVQKNREDLVAMMKYVTACRVAREENLIQTVIGKRHLVEECSEVLENGNVEVYSLYSMSDLEGIYNGTLNSFLIDLREKFREHIVNCEICKGKGYLCELCGNNEVIFPFDCCAFPCARCNSIFHRVCRTKKSICPKCTRIEKRFTSDENKEELENQALECTEDI